MSSNWLWRWPCQSACVWQNSEQRSLPAIVEGPILPPVVPCRQESSFLCDWNPPTCRTMDRGTQSGGSLSTTSVAFHHRAGQRWELVWLHSVVPEMSVEICSSCWLGPYLVPQTVLLSYWRTNTPTLKSFSKQTSFWWRDRTLQLPLQWVDVSIGQNKMVCQRTITFLKHWA